MTVTVILEPDPGGHRFQYVRHVVDAAARDGEVVLLTCRGASASAEFAAYLAGAAVKVEECFDRIRPPTRELAEAAADAVAAAGRGAATVVLVMDADQALKRWWLEAPRAFRRLPRRPRVVFLLTRYPAQLSPWDRVGWKYRIPKASLAVLARRRRVLDRTVTITGRGDRSRGWLIARVRDPAICTAHARDRTAVRAELGLPADRRLVGVLGVIDGRKNVPLVAAACAANDAELVLAGTLLPDVRGWLDERGADDAPHVRVRAGFLTNDEIDRFVAAVDVVAVAQNNNGPSGIMGKALAAGVPVLTAGSVVRARELGVTGGGLATELTGVGLTDGLRTLLAGTAVRPAAAGVVAGPAEFADALLGPVRRR